MINGWSPQPGPQEDLCDCPFPEVFFGGARGSGKTDGVLGKWALKERRYKQHFNAIMFRKTTVSAEDAIERSKEIYGPLGGQFNETKSRWRMPNGGRMTFAYLETIADADEYQGRNVTDAWVEEAGQYPIPAPIDRLFGVLRSAHGVPVQLILTGNPGGAGQHWIRERYHLHPFPKGPQVHERLTEAGTHRVAVIPGRIAANRILLELDPGYIQRLHLVGSKQLVNAWLNGDWTAVEGAFFEEWSEVKHVISPFDIPSDWVRFRSADWGSYSPFSVGWWAVALDDFALPAIRLSKSISAAMGEPTKIIPRGAIVRYREWYGKLGGKLTAEEVANGIIDREREDRRKLSYGVLDPSAFAESGGPSIAERINLTLGRAGLVMFREADNKRITRTVGDKQKSGPMGGWDQMRGRMIGKRGSPMIYWFSTCTDSIRTIPVLQHDQTRSEDLDTDAEDHAADDCRYACMSRPWNRILKVPERPKDGYGLPEKRFDESDSVLLL